MVTLFFFFLSIYLSIHLSVFIIQIIQDRIELNTILKNNKEKKCLRSYIKAIKHGKKIQ
jgi:hypothetical protein